MYARFKDNYTASVPAFNERQIIITDETNSSTGTDVPEKSSAQHSTTLELVDFESYQEDDVVEEDDLEDLPIGYEVPKAER